MFSARFSLSSVFFSLLSLEDECASFPVNQYSHNRPPVGAHKSSATYTHTHTEIGVDVNCMSPRKQKGDDSVRSTGRFVSFISISFTTYAVALASASAFA